MLAPVMIMREGGRILAETGGCSSRRRARQPGLVAALEVVAVEGARTFYGALGEALQLMDERNGLVTPADLAAYRVEWQAPVEASYAGTSASRPEAGSPASRRPRRLPGRTGVDPGERALALARILAAPPFSGRTYEHTTNLCVVDPAGSACVLTTSLGLGSGDFLPRATST